LLKLHAVVQLAIGIIFLLSSVGKLLERSSFIQGVAAYRIVPASWASLTASIVITGEMFVAAAHLTGFRLKPALVVGIGLIASFGIAVGVNLKRDRPLPCYCFGGSGSVVTWGTLARLGFLGAGETFLLKLYQPIYVPRLILPELGFALFWSIFLLVGSLWLFAIGDVLRLLRPVR
jgi:Methylamine utilisation protein MauE